MRYLSLLVLLLGTSVAFADLPKVSVNGPSVVEPGQLIVLKAVGDATNYLWIPDSDLGQILQCSPSTIGMASPRLGIHKVLLIGSNDKGEMSFSTHVLKIEKPTDPVTPPPTDPTDPKPPVDPKPVIDYANLHRLSVEGAKKLNDPVTSLQMQNTLNRILPDLVKASSVESAKKLTTINVENILLMRDSSARRLDWVSSWRKPIFEELSKYQFKNTTDYANAVKAIASGLTNTPFCIDCK